MFCLQNQQLTCVIVPKPLLENRVASVEEQVHSLLCYTVLALDPTVAGFLPIEIWSWNPTFSTSDYLRRKLKIIGMRSLCLDAKSVLPAPAADQEHKNSFVHVY